MKHRWVILLAGGEGTRVRALAQDENGCPAPKQYCRFGGDNTLFRRALDRARALTDEGRVIAVVRAAHRRWWARELRELSRENLVEARVEHGTAAAVLRALRHVLARDPDAEVVVIPADHSADDEGAFCASIRRTADAAADWPRHLILLGMEPDVAGEDYGWIVPTMCAGYGTTAAVTSFHEKPDPERARWLVEHGALINTLVVAATGSALARLYSLALPELVHALESGAAGAHDDAKELRARDISRDLFERMAPHLRVLRGARCGWSDLGTPARLRAWNAHREGAGARREHHDVAHS